MTRYNTNSLYRSRREYEREITKLKDEIRGNKGEKGKIAIIGLDSETALDLYVIAHAMHNLLMDLACQKPVDLDEVKDVLGAYEKLNVKMSVS